MLPCTLVDLREIWNYIKVTRAKIIRDTSGCDKDHGFVFVSEVTGLPLLPNTVTQEIHKLARHCGINTRVSPHMFRHRFITKIFVAMIHNHDFKTPGEFRHALLGLKSLKQQLMEWSGHRSVTSLDHYIDLAFSEVNQMRSAMDAVKAGLELDALRSAIASLALELGANGDAGLATSLQALLKPGLDK
jgi:integrase